MLDSLGGDIGVLEVGHILLVGVGVGVEGQLFARRSLQLEIGSELDVARQFQHQGCILGQRLAYIVRGVGKVSNFFKFDGCDHGGVEVAEGQVSGLGDRRGVLPLAVIIALAHKLTQVVPCIKVDVTFRQHGGLGIAWVIRPGGDPVLVAVMPGGLPGAIRADGHAPGIQFKDQPRLGVLVPLLVQKDGDNGTVPGAAVESHQQCDGVLPLLQIGELHCIIVAVVRSGAPLQRTVQHGQLPVDPQHVLVYSRNKRGSGGDGLIQVEGLAESHIAVLCAALSPDPIGGPVCLFIPFNAIQIHKIRTVCHAPIRDNVFYLH